MRAVLLLAPGAFLGALVAAPGAFAQTAASAPAATSLFQSSSGDRGGDAGAFSGYRLAAPLRLSLEASVIAKGGGFPNCASREDPVGNSVGGIPVQHYSEVRLAPRLVLSGFTQLGCPVDAGMGAALTYAAPIRPSMQLVSAAGLYAAPGQLPLFAGPQASWLQFLGSLKTFAVRGLTGDSPVQQGVRVDLVWGGKDGTHHNLGIESVGTGKTGIRFGGGF